jgi:hypothetical protein
VNKRRNEDAKHVKIFDQLPFMLVFYEVSIEQAARSAISSFLAYGDALDRASEEDVVATHLHDALTHCAAISRFFWPPSSAGSVASERAEKLRVKYNVDQTSPLANRALRNALEHFDERLDNWVLQNPVGPIAATPIIADESIIENGFGHAFKVIDPVNDVYIILGERFEFGPVATEVVRIFSAEDD